jgi:hypothetical protein
VQTSGVSACCMVQIYRGKRGFVGGRLRSHLLERRYRTADMQVPMQLAEILVGPLHLGLKKGQYVVSPKRNIQKGKSKKKSLRQPNSPKVNTCP